MNKQTLQLNKDEIRLATIKEQIDMLRMNRRELMYRLNNSGMSHVKIAAIYGCTRQYVQQEIETYSQDVTQEPRLQKVTG